MRLSTWLLTPGVALGSLLSSSQRDYSTTDYFSIKLHHAANPQDVALQLNATLEGQIGELDHHYTISCPKASSPALQARLSELKRKRKLTRRNDINEEDSDSIPLQWHQKQVLRQRHQKRIPPPAIPARQRQASPKTDTPLTVQQAADKIRLASIALDLGITDPIFQEQWHLFNFMQKGVDINITGVWQNGVTGQGVTTCIIDDGLDFESNDLQPNYYAKGSYDFNDKGPDPKPRLADDRHGTRCAGEIGAAKNDVCGVGVAYDSKISGVRILSAPISDEDEAAAINYDYQNNDIYSCSWGPPDDGKTMEAPDTLIKKAIVNGIQKGRAGKGSVFVFAAGNGASKHDNCNFDGYTNSIYSITTGAIDRTGSHPYYSEKCSALLIVTPSSGSGDAIHTTDVGTNQCYNGHGGTSAAGPLMAGAVALALSVRPDLTWRDLQYLVVEAALPFNLDVADSDWIDTAIGKKYSHTYGYGKLDTFALIEATKTWELVKPQAWYFSPWLSVVHDVPEGENGLAASFDVTSEMLKTANLKRLEHVTVTMNVNHTRRGDLSVELKSPSGITSHIATARQNDGAAAGYVDWTFMSVVHWGESGVGTWTVIVKDTNKNGHQGVFVDWRLKLWGEAIDAANQALVPLPDEHDDDHETATASVTTTSVEASPPPTDLPEHPSDHPERPTKPKPTGAGLTTTVPPNITSAPTSTTTPDTQASPQPTADGFLSGFFPTFGVSKKTQIWIYGSLGLIIVFCLGLGAYFLVQRRKRQRNSRDNYEFEMINDRDIDERQGLRGSKRGQGRQGRDLYDAFAGESDDENDLFGDDSDDDDAGYRDTPSHDTGSGSNSGSGTGSLNEKS